MPPLASPNTFTRRDLYAIVVAVSIFILHALLFGGWIVDDAGISFAYARNLAGGHGLVSQPGALPVEGYSNPLWVLLMAMFFALGAFHPVVTPKIVGIVLVTLSFAITYATAGALSGGRRSVSSLVIVCLALNTPFVVWAVSGLENSLYVLVTCSLLGLAVLPVRPPRREPVWFALLAVCAALTRPDGIVYACLYPIVTTVRGNVQGEPFRRIGRDVFIYLGLIAGIGATLLGLRLLYFHDLLPNTYYAKAGAPGRNLLLAGRMSSLVDGVTGFGGSSWLLSMVFATAFLIRRDQMGWPHLVSMLFLCVAISVFLLLPADWFGEFRFGSPFFVFFLVHGLVTLRLALESFESSPGRRNRAWVGASALVIAASVLLGERRSLRFAQNLPLPFSAIEQRTRRFDGYATEFGIENGSMLTPDLGAALYFSRLKIFDLAMLCDRTIARTLGTNPAAFYDYVFERVKPTFIHTHDLWTCLARFDDDPRFRRDYVPIREWTGDAWVFEGSAVRMLYSGDYVRRDALTSTSASRPGT